MTTAGLQVINDSGVIQIDDSYTNLVFIEKHNYTSGGDHTIVLAGCTTPIPVFSSTDANGIMLMACSNSGGTWTWRVSGIGDVYIFDVPPTPAAHGAGLQVFDASGSPTFDSSFSVMRHIGFKMVFPHFNGVAYPTQTVSTLVTGYASGGYNYNTMEPIVGPGRDTAYTVPSVTKLGWVHNGDVRCWDEDFASSGGDGNFHRFLVAWYQSGTQMKVKLRANGLVGSGEYWPGAGHSWVSVLSFIDLTGL